jgi:hypothetical protein
MSDARTISIRDKIDLWGEFLWSALLEFRPFWILRSWGLRMAEEGTPNVFVFETLFMEEF